MHRITYTTTYTVTPLKEQKPNLSVTHTHRVILTNHPLLGYTVEVFGRKAWYLKYESARAEYDWITTVLDCQEVEPDDPTQSIMTPYPL